MKSKATLFATFLASIPAAASAAVHPVSLPGTTSYDGWADLRTGNPAASAGAVGYPGSAAWAAGGINSNTPGSADAAFTKVSGNGYVSTASTGYVYSTLAGAQSGTATLVPSGSFRITDDTPVGGLQTIVAQFDISFWDDPAVNQPFGTGGTPRLSYNGGAQQLPATYTAATQTGTATGMGTANIFLMEYQWDTRTLGTINAFTIDYGVTTHSQQYAMRLDQGSQFVQAVPEPASLGLLAPAGLLLLSRRRRPAAV